MKVAISATDRSLNARVAADFVRCDKFVFYDTESKQVAEIADNPGAKATVGAAILASRFVVNKGAQAVLSGIVGSTAAEVLAAGEVTVYTNVLGTVQEAIEKFLAGILQPASTTAS